MSDTEYANAVAEFLRKKTITRCPTACLVPTRAHPTDADRDALRNYEAAREAARLARLRSNPQLIGY